MKKDASLKNTIPLRNLTLVTFGFYLANIFLVIAMYYKIDLAEPFLCIASGVLLFAFFLKRFLNQILGDR